MLVALVGCVHGTLERIYSTVLSSGSEVRLLICCGDFQSVRAEADLAALAVPPKYRQPGDFHLYYNGQKKAPILTIFIGGNHEASNYLQELPYGGWVAPNIYYLGNAGVLSVAGIRIAGISGIFKGHDYLKGHFEVSPYSESTKRSVYHIRNLEVFRLRQLSGAVNVCLSHDWPNGIVHYGDLDKLLQRKPFFREDIEEGRLGSPPCEDLLNHLRPDYWFAAHMHCLFPAIVPHMSTGTKTRFLALDKCLPNRKFLQILDIPHDESQEIELKYDLEWLTILRLTNHLLSVRPMVCHMPGEHGNERYHFTPTEEEKNKTLDMFKGNLVVPNNFSKTIEPPDFSAINFYNCRPSPPVSNPQTTLFCDLLQIDDPVSLIMLQNGTPLETPNINNDEEIIDDDGDEEVKDNNDNKDESSTFQDIAAQNVTEKSSECPLASRLSLPEPVKNYEESEKEPSSNELEKNNSVCDITSDRGNVESPDPSATIQTSAKKIFKRRNENLYASNLDD